MNDLEELRKKNYMLRESAESAEGDPILHLSKAAVLSLIDAAESLAQALADVRTLDEWALTEGIDLPRMIIEPGRGCKFDEPRLLNLPWAPNQEAARHAAAEWVRKKQG